ncbi:MAG: succinate dehydrogenase assembly factor 2 [Proteobacteria bacterium]|nr:succinate dehydrogenase assembly factor 2 [Pseudomonadota bacterium]
MRELDELLLGYFERHYGQAGDNEKVAFRSLLALSDPELVGYLLQKEIPAADFALVIEHILDRTDA